MADIRKRKGARGDTYQVRYAKPDGGYAFRSFDRRRDAADFIESLSSRKRLNTAISTVSEAVDTWLDVCGKEGRDGRPPVSSAVAKLYKHRAAIIKSYDWDKPLQDLGRPDDVDGRLALLSSDQPFLVLGTNVNEVCPTLSDVRTALERDFRSMTNIRWGTYRHCALIASTTMGQALVELPLTFTAGAETQQLVFRFGFGCVKAQGQWRIFLAMGCLPHPDDTPAAQ